MGPEMSRDACAQLINQALSHQQLQTVQLMAQEAEDDVIVHRNIETHQANQARIEADKQEIYKNLEIQAIQAEIQAQRNTWQSVYSDEEDETDIESALSRNRKRKETTSSSSSSSCSTSTLTRPFLDGPQFEKGERWKRLKIMAETKVKNNPEKYASIPKHKFPLRD